MEKILVVEDEKNIRDLIVLNLKMSSYEPLEAEDGNKALHILQNEKVSLVVLDINIPGINGFKVCEIIKKEYPQTAVIMVTAQSQDIDKITGLESGADDYIVKPFNPLEFIARIRSVLRRCKLVSQSITTNNSNNSIIINGDLTLNIQNKIVKLASKEIKFKPKEFELLAFLVQHPNVLFTRDELLNSVWGIDFLGEGKTVDVHIRRIREKIESDPSNPQFIETVWGTGYRWRKI